MDWKTLLLSPNGRINRARYWLAVIVVDVVFFVLYLPFVLTIDKTQTALSAGQIAYMAFIGVLALLLTYVGVVLGIKRFHDRDKSGWWVLIAIVPIIGGLWYFIEVGFLRGTMGRNRFGPDPLSPGDDIVQVFGTPDQQSIR